MIFDIAEYRPVVLSYFFPDAPYQDIMTTTRSLQVQEVVTLIALEVARLEKCSSCRFSMQ